MAVARRRHGRQGVLGCPRSQTPSISLRDVLCPCCDATLPAPSIVGRDRLQGTVGSFSVSICPQCGSGTTLPRVPENELGPFYPSGYGPHTAVGRRTLLDRVSAALQPWHEFRRYRARPFNALQRLSPGRLVDAGCGRGDLGVSLLGRGWRVTGIEPSHHAAQVASARGIDVRTGTLSSVELELGTYDAAVMEHSLEHTVDPVHDLALVAAALKPGAPLMIAVPHFGSWQRRLFGSYWFHLDLPRHRTHFTRKGLIRAIERSGLRVVDIGTGSSVVGLPGSLQYAIAKRCLFSEGLALRVAAGLCLLPYPASKLADRIAGDGDALYVVAERAS